MELKKRVYVNEIKKGPVVLAGWVHNVRDLAKVKFILLRDMTGIVQCIMKDEKLFKKFSGLTLESVVALKGKVKSADVKSPDVTNNKVEIEIDDIDLISRAEKLPITVTEKAITTSLPKRLDYRYIDLRKPKIKAIFKVRSIVTKAAEDFLTDKGFIQIHTPKLMGTPSESGANVFKASYFDKIVFLAQSPQFYKQAALVGGFDRVFEIGEVFRAEKHHTPRHLCEYTSLDFEMAFIKDYEDVMGIMEDLMITILKRVKEKCKDELSIFNIKVDIPKKPFPRISMKEAKKVLGIKSPESEDLNDAEEEKLGEYIKKKYKTDFVFLIDFPWQVRPFYHYKKDKTTTASFDLLYKGLEITTGSQREHRYKILKEQAKDKGVSEKDNPWYFEQFRYGVPPHGGSGTGIGRIVKQLLGLDNLREAVLFPRDPERILP